MLTSYKLDDQDFFEIAKRAKRQIQSYAPSWTNENASDPGITILELLAWIKDNLTFYMDQSHLIGQEALLNMLSFKRLNAETAKIIGYIPCNRSAGLEYFPVGYPFCSSNIVFELKNEITIQTCELTGILSAKGNSENVITDLTMHYDNRAPIFPFGKQASVDDCVYFGFDYPLRESCSLFIDLIKEPAGFRNWNEGQVFFGNGVWEYMTLSDEEADWTELNVQEDQTNHMTQSGILRFYVDENERFKFETIGSKKAYWIRYRLLDADYDYVPAIESIVLNAVELVQKSSLVVTDDDLKVTDIKNVYRSNRYYPLQAISRLEIESELGYEAVDSREYHIESDVYGRLYIHMNSTEPISDSTNLRLITAYPPLNNIPNFDIKGMPFENVETGLSKVIKSSLCVEVIEDYDCQEWRRWQVVNHLWESDHADRHIEFDSDTGILGFGNNEKGMLPDPKKNGLRVIHAESSLFSRGNGSFEILTSENEAQVVCLAKATSGKEEETIEQSFKRFSNEFNTSCRLVTENDIKQIIKTTPGLAIRDASVLPGESIDDPGRIVVLRKTHDQAISDHPRLTKTYRTALKDRVEKLRLITEEWIIEEPVYEGIAVHISIIKDPAVRLSEENIENIVKSFVESDEGSQFGKHISVVCLKEILEKVQGVLRISKVEIAAGNTIYKKSDGDIRLPKYVISYLSNLKLEIRNLVE